MTTGRCLCGSVTYAVDGEPIATLICHCRNCQRQAGSAFSVIVGYPSAAVTVQGTLKTYDDVADSGATVQRQFCPNCGSPLFSIAATSPGATFVKAGSLDDISRLAPQFQIWCKSAHPWLTLDAALAQFAENPPVPA